MGVRENVVKFTTLRWTPILPVVLGLLLLGLLLAQTEPGYHFICDSGLKEYNLWLWEQNRSISNELSMPGAPDWARTIWRDGYFPIQPPFEFAGKIVFPPFFQLASYPFWRLFGYYGLFIVPALSVLGLWAVLWRFWERNGLGGFPALVGMSLLTISPFTFYGAMFWEHASAVLLFVFGFVTVIESAQVFDRELRSKFFCSLAGASIVCAQAMRPELIFGTFVVSAITVLLSRGRVYLLFGMVAAIIGCVVINTLCTGSPIGIHHQQERFLNRGDWVQNLLDYYALNAMDFLAQTPAITMVLITSVVLQKKQPSASRERLALIAIIALSFLLLICILPNLGGFQIYRRYFLIVIPIGAMLAAPLTRHRAWVGAALLGLHVISLPSLITLVDEFGWSFKERVKPLVEQIESDPPGAIVSVTNDGVLDLISRMPQVPFFQIHTEKDLLDLLERLHPQVAPEKVVFIFVQHANDPIRGRRTITLRDGRVYVLKKFNNGRSIYYLFRLIPERAV